MPGDFGAAVDGDRLDGLIGARVGARVEMLTGRHMIDTKTVRDATADRRDTWWPSQIIWGGDLGAFDDDSRRWALACQHGLRALGLLAEGGCAMRAVVVIVLAAVLLTGCGQNAEPGATPGAAPAAGDPKPIPPMVVDHPIVVNTPTPEPLLDLDPGPAPTTRAYMPSGELSYGTAGGYKYRITWLSPTVTVTVDKANAKPGYVLVNADVAFKGVLHNETDGHNAPANGPTLVPFWNASSPVCSSIAGAAVIGESKTYCRFPNLTMGIGDPNGAILLSGDAVSVSGGGRFINPGVVGETVAPQIATDLEYPAGWLFAVADPVEKSFCFLDTGMYVIWSSLALNAQGTC